MKTDQLYFLYAFLVFGKLQVNWTSFLDDLVSFRGDSATYYKHKEGKLSPSCYDVTCILQYRFCCLLNGLLLISHEGWTLEMAKSLIWNSALDRGLGVNALDILDQYAPFSNTQV